VTAEHLLVFQRNIPHSTPPARGSRRTMIHINMMLLKHGITSQKTSVFNKISVRSCNFTS